MQKIVRKNQKAIGIILFFALFISIFTFSPLTSYACSCAEPYPVKEELERSSAVFSGKVVEIVDKNKSKAIQSSADPIAVRFEVEESWKKISQTQIIVYTERSSASCGYRFDLGKEYLVYAHEADGELWANICSRTALLTAAVNDVQELGKGEKRLEKEPIKLDVNEGKNQSFSEHKGNMSIIYTIIIILALLVVVVFFIARRNKK